MRARWLKAAFWNDRKMGTLGVDAALVYEALWCYADDFGTAQCDPDRVKGELFTVWPEMTLPRISEALRRLAAAGRIVRYRVGDDTFCTIPTFGKHQKVHNPSDFAHPKMSEGVALPVPDFLGTTPEDLGSTRGLDVQMSLGSDVQKDPLRSLASLARVSENSSMHENGARHEMPAVQETTAPVGNEHAGAPASTGDPAVYAPAFRQEVSTGEVAHISTPGQVYIISTPKSLNVNNLGDFNRSGVSTVGGCGEPAEEGGENSDEPPSRQASRNASLETDQRTVGHSIHAVDTNPVAENVTRQILPVPGAKSPPAQKRRKQRPAEGGSAPALGEEREVGVQEPKGAIKPTLRASWPALAAEIHSAAGWYEPGRWGKALKPMVDRHGRSRVLFVVAKATEHALRGAESAAFVTPERIAREFADHMPAQGWAAVGLADREAPLSLDMLGSYFIEHVLGDRPDLRAALLPEPVSLGVAS